MSNIAVILAGGTGTRLGADKPKQFVEVLGKPLIAYSMEIYEKSNYIDEIEVVCIKEYQDYIRQLAEEYKITKLKYIAAGGESCQESIKNGIFNLEGKVKDADLLIFNMSTSIFVTDDILKSSIDTALEYGSAFAGMKCIYNNAETFDGLTANNIHFKETHVTLNLPWTCTYRELYDMYKYAYDNNIETSEASYMPTLFLALGKTMYISKDTSLNKLHITTPEDLEICTSILEHRQKEMK